MKMISEYRGQDGRTATVEKNLTLKLFEVKYYSSDEQLLQSATYPHLDKAEASAEDFCLGEAIYLDDSSVVECGPVTLTPVNPQ